MKNFPATNIQCWGLISATSNNFEAIDEEGWMHSKV
jgi:hypothetical protein